MLDHVTVAVGNRAEVEVAVGTSDPHEAATRLLDRGVELALVKMGGEGVLVATADSRDVVAPHPVEVVCGLGAGDAFGGALVHGLLAGWDPVKIAGYANAAGAIVASRLACADAMPTLDELDALVVSSRRTRMTVAVEQLTRGPATARRSPTPSGATCSSAAPPTPAPSPRRTPPAGARRGSSPTAAPCSWSPPTTRRVARSPRAATRWRWPTGVPCSPGSSRRCEHPDVDGVLGTPDIVEELLLLGALEDKVVIGSMNRGGLDGATWTMDDRFTGYDAASIAACGLEGGKMLLRIDDTDSGTAATIEACAQGGQRARRAAAWWPWSSRCPTSATSDGTLFLRKDAPALSRAVTIASGLGTTSAYTWLKMPSCDDYETVFGVDHAAVRRARRRAQPGPGSGPRVLGPDALAPGRARARRRPGAALPARRRRRLGGARGGRGARRAQAGGLT